MRVAGSGAGVCPSCPGSQAVAAGGWRSGAARLTLGPRALAAPGDMMIDRVSPPARMRPLSLFRPSACPARQGGEQLTAAAGAGRGCAPSDDCGCGLPARPRVTGNGHRLERVRAQAAVSASSPSSARMWQAWRMSLRACARAAILPSVRSLTAA